MRPGHIWSREEVLDWLLKRSAKEPTLFGFDFSFAPPFAERGAYLPGEEGIPGNARAFWAYVDGQATTRISVLPRSWSEFTAGTSTSALPTE